jgi:hypothetical protein
VRQITKGDVPTILAENHAVWLSEYLANTSSETFRYRYRAQEIKEALRRETGWKCVYCESKIGHNTPGDVEHKVPSSKDRSLHFTWSNLTVACGECNRRKGDYFEVGAPFLDPYIDPVEEWLLHLGPIVYWVPANARAEFAVRTLSLDSTERAQLIQRKLDILEKARALTELIAVDTDDQLLMLRKDELNRMQDSAAEYSAMVRAYVLACQGTR